MILTTESVTREALKILNRSFNDSYTKQYRTTTGGNEYIHGVSQRDILQGETPAISTGTAEISRENIQANPLL
jgi:hypothetical protein